MGDYRTRILEIFLLFTATAFADLPNLVEGTYKADHDKDLTISKKEGGYWLDISVVAGESHHICEFSAPIKGNMAIRYVNDETEPPCKVQIRQVTKDSVVTERINSTTMDCGCGANADVEYEWGKSYEKCSLPTIRKGFLSFYKKKNYQAASELLRAFIPECDRFLFEPEGDALYNDLAISLYHEGKKQECRDILKKTFFASEVVNLDNFEQEFNEALDEKLVWPWYDNYKKLGYAIHYNYNLCK